MGLMKKLSAALVASSLVFSLVGSAFAAYTPAAGETAGKRMQALNLVTGRGDGDLALTSEITRAELVTIIVRAFGQEENAKLLKGSAVFTDTANHWASGNIAMAAALVEKAGGEPMGLPGGKFAPDDKLSAAQAVAFLMKFLGVKADAAKAWPANYLDKAVEMNLITAEDKALLTPIVNQNAPRGLAFYLFDNAFYTYKLANGKTFYTQYVDTTGPVITLGAFEATTPDSKVTITGTAKDAVEVYVGTQKVTTDATGKFSADVALPEMKEYNIVVTARDIAGNATEQPAKVTRMVGKAAVIEATDITVTAGGTVEVKAAVKDAKGNTVEAAVTGTATTGTYADGKYTAGKTIGTDTLVLKSGELTKEVKVTVTAGALAKVVPSKTSAAPGEKVTLVAQDENGNALTGVTFTQTSADALVDSINGSFIASKAGNYTVTAKLGDVSKDVVIGVYSTTVAKYKLTASADNVIANNATTIDLTIQAVDANGNLVANEPTTARTTSLTATGFEYLNSSNVWTSLDTAQTITLKNGVATVKVRTQSDEYGGRIDKLFTGASLTATDSTNVGITLVDQVATSLVVENDAVFLPSNATNVASNFTVKVLDQAGKTMLRGYYAVDVALTGPATILNGTTTTTHKVYFNNGSAPTVTINPSAVAVSGTATLTATATGLTSGSDSVTVQMPGPAAKLVLTADKDNKATPKANEQEAVTYKVQVTDAAGVLKSDVNDATNFKVVFPDLTSSTWTKVKVGAAANTNTALSSKEYVLTVVNGEATFVVETTKFVGALNFNVKDARTAGLAASETLTATFKADRPQHIAITVNGVEFKSAAAVAASAPEATIVAQMYDAAGNKAGFDGAKIKLAGTAAAGGLASDIVINGEDNEVELVADANGMATFPVKVGNYVNATYTLTATAAYKNGTTDVAVSSVFDALKQVAATTLTVSNSVASGIQIGLFSDAAMTLPVSTVSANANTYVKATVTDAAGRKLTGQTLAFYSQNADSTWSAVAGTVTETSGTYSFTLNPTVAPSMTFKVENQTVAPYVTSQFSVGVRPDSTVAGVVITGADEQDIVKGQVKAFTVSVADTHGNVIVNNTTTGTPAVPANVTVTLNFTNITAGKLVQVRNSADGFAISSQTANATSATATVTIPYGAPSVTFYVVTDDSVGSDFDMEATMGSGNTDTVQLNVK